MRTALGILAFSALLGSLLTSSFAQAELPSFTCYQLMRQHRDKVVSMPEVVNRCSERQQDFDLEVCRCRVVEEVRPAWFITEEAKIKRGVAAWGCSMPSEHQLPDYMQDVPYLFSSRVSCPRPHECYSTLEAKPACADTMAALPPDTNLERQALRGYCQVSVPRDAREAFAPANDVPANLIARWTPEYLESRWRGKEASLGTSYGGAPVSVVYRLNLEASAIWSSTVACYQGDAEAARAAYFEAKFACADPTVDGEALRARIAQFLTNVEDFFSSTEFPRAVMNCPNAKELANFIAENEPSVVYPINAFPSLHPLFMQASLQALLQTAPVGESISMKRFIERSESGMKGKRFLNALSQFSAWIPEAACSTYGLWPSASRSAVRVLKQTWLDLLMTVPPMGRLIRVRDFGLMATGCSMEFLPGIYVQKDLDITRELRAITPRYLKSKEEKKCFLFFCS